MWTGIKRKARKWIPPVLEPLFVRAADTATFSGDFESWQKACQHTRGYSADNIFLKVKEASLAVKRGEAAYEQDSVLFPVRTYNWPLLAQLMSMALRRGGRLHVLDFGGSLGSVFFRHRPFWTRSGAEFRWSVVEQEHFVRCGQELFQETTLRFYPTIEACMADARPDVVLASGVVQYLDEPHLWLEQLMNHGVDFLIFDRTLFSRTNRDRICVQQVGEHIYTATYPTWLLSRTHFLETLSRQYHLLDEWKNDEHYNDCSVEGFSLEKR